ncbi:M3 family metallopeptidase [Opitutus terrae]|uniref:oligopeptidase A n=1 Tax=Opitutus terrae (strain DSM 11246 / JCM 15787 / PB90-1) TaxID=452637 RepID=B1ZVA2_OPITP|nr:M3 family metallopeptidase [Opitutus terrae]ACB76769.1 Oligopeptidase A [Opitutus terrae PB90-1]
MADNPFLDRRFHIRWSRLDPQHIESAISEALDRAQVAIDRIAATPLGEVTYENTFLALEHATEEINEAWGKVTHLQSVADSPAVRAAHNAMLPRVTSFFARIPLNLELWRRLGAFANSSNGRALQGVARRFVDETQADFRQAGADLPEAQRQRLEALQAELAELTQKYSENVLDATNAWQLVVTDESRLKGLPEHARTTAREKAAAKGETGWLFTLHQPSQEPLMTYAEDESLRREVWSAAVGVGAESPYDNTALITRILRLRAEKAALLGKPHFADLVLERRMAKSGARAEAFLADLQQRAATAFQRECRELEEFRAQQTRQPVRPLAPWELAFWAERLRQARYAFDEEALRPYFPMNRVIPGLFELARRVFGLEITVRPSIAGVAADDTVEVWHPEVKFYDVHDRTGRHVGSFYADWHPRESKRGGAWMNYLITGGPTAAGQRAPHLGLICGNLTPPTADRPALLTHREVETIFHEFGHLLHHLLGEVEIKSLNGVNVAWDFVELPSQLMENWCWEREGLDLFARHDQTGAPIPDDLFAKMTAARNFRSACATMRQLSLARMDLALHMRTADFVAAADIEPLARAAIAECLVPTEPPAPTVVKRFTHVFADPVGYAAGYYSYKWAEVLDADAFTRFQREGLFNAGTGAAFIEHVLSRGNSADPAELFRRFMGREPDLNALLRRSGLAPAA